MSNLFLTGRRLEVWDALGGRGFKLSTASNSELRAKSGAKYNQDVTNRLQELEDENYIHRVFLPATSYDRFHAGLTRVIHEGTRQACQQEPCNE